MQAYLCVLAIAALAPGPPRTASRAMLNRIDEPRELCSRCRRPPYKHGRRFCICDQLPPSPITLQHTRILVLQHPAESKKTIASVPLIPLCVDQFDLRKGNHFDADLEPLRQAMEEGYEPLLLFPGPGALALDAPQLSRPMLHGDHRSKASSPSHVSSDPREAAAVRKVVLVLIDGTWTQARHMMRHSPELASACTHVMFEERVDSIINPLRREPEQHCTSTLEACARALRLVEATEQAAAAADHMERALKAIVAAQLSMVGFTGSQPRFVDRKRRTWNRKLYRSDGPPRASPGALTSAPASAPPSPEPSAEPPPSQVELAAEPMPSPPVASAGAAAMGATGPASTGVRLASAGTSSVVSAVVSATGHDANGFPTHWSSLHHGCIRRDVWRRDTAKWLRRTAAAAAAAHGRAMGDALAGEEEGVVTEDEGVDVEEEGEEEEASILPDDFHIVSGLPDISEVRPKVTPAEYEAWCIDVVRDMLTVLPPNRVAIFYQTPGRFSGEDGSWLDKQYLVTAGARAAGALCVWQKVVLFQDSVGRKRGGTRAGWVTLLCFSKQARVPRDYTTVDVLADRGHMTYSHATGEDACAAAIEYCIEESERAAAQQKQQQQEEEEEGGEVGSGPPPDGGRSSTQSSVPIVDPFCGYGSVLAVANAYGLPAVGLDVSLKCCAKAAEHEASQALVEAHGERRAERAP